MDVDPIPLAKGRRKSSGGLSGRKGLFGSFKSPRDKSALDAIGEAETDDATKPVSLATVGSLSHSCGKSRG